MKNLKRKDLVIKIMFFSLAITIIMCIYQYEKIRNLKFYVATNLMLTNYELQDNMFNIDGILKDEDISDEELQVVKIYIKSYISLLKLNNMYDLYKSYSKMDAELSSYLDGNTNDKNKVIDELRKEIEVFDPQYYADRYFYYNKYYNYK